MTVAGSIIDKTSDISRIFIIVKSAPAKAGDFRLRLKARSIDDAADLDRYKMAISSAGFGNL